MLTLGFALATLGMAALTAFLMMILGMFGFFPALLIAPLWTCAATCAALAAYLRGDADTPATKLGATTTR